MLDNESITIHATQIDGQSYPDDYTVIWRGLPIGRIRKNPGLPDHVDQWSWGCNVYGQQSAREDSGQGTDLEEERNSTLGIGGLAGGAGGPPTAGNI